MRYLFGLQLFFIASLLCGCSTVPQQECPVDTQNLPDCPPLEAVEDEAIDALHELRTWLPPSKLTIDPVKYGKQAEIPINSAEARIIGPRHDEALDSLAPPVKISRPP